MWIANTDRHFGNITRFDRYAGAFELAPAYDRLPMLLAPRRGQMVERQYLSASAALRRTGPAARALAEHDRALLVDEERLSEPFRRICARSLETLQSAPGKAH